jgi:hypothetical protein
MMMSNAFRKTAPSKRLFRSNGRGEEICPSPGVVAREAISWASAILAMVSRYAPSA